MKDTVEVMVETEWQMENMQGDADECVSDKPCPSYFRYRWSGMKALMQ